MGNETIVERIRKSAIVDAMVSKSSREVDTPLEVLADEKVVVFGEIGPGASRATRTEIELDNDTLVVVHKNTALAEGIFAAAARFSHIEILKSGRVATTLQIEVDPTTSQFNPIYLFRVRGSKMGKGYGQHIDLYIAERLLDVVIPGVCSDYVQPVVIDWIRSVLQTIA